MSTRSAGGDSVRALAWIQGLAENRKDDDGKDWRPVVLRRITGLYGEIELGKTTERSEGDLDIEAHAYFAVGTSSPSYGRNILVFTFHDLEDASDLTLTPFDSGGLASGQIAGSELLDGDERTSLLAKYTFPSDAFVGPMAEWIATAFSSVALYVAGLPPTELLVDEFRLEKGQDSRAWIWEGQLAARSYTQHPFGLRHIFFQTEDKQALLDYLDDQPKGTVDKALYSLIVETGEEHADPYRAMIERLYVREAA